MAKRRRITSAATVNRNSTFRSPRKAAVQNERPSRGPSTPAKQILVPIDFSDCSRAALGCAVWLARPLKARLILLYVAETAPAGSEFGANHSGEFEADLRRMAKKQLGKLRQEIPKEMASQVVIRAGRADAEILEVASSLQADLIVMATHSKCSQPGQLGTTAGRVASIAECPVLLVPVHELAVPFFI